MRRCRTVRHFLCRRLKPARGSYNQPTQDSRPGLRFFVPRSGTPALASLTAGIPPRIVIPTEGFSTSGGTCLSGVPPDSGSYLRLPSAEARGQAPPSHTVGLGWLSNWHNASASGAKDDSPPFQRWVGVELRCESPGDDRAFRWGRFHVPCPRHSVIFFPASHR